MGGKNPTIVLADADLKSAVENVANASFFSTGQKCTATSRAIVEDAIYDEFLAALIERTKKLTVGDGMKAGIDIGPRTDTRRYQVPVATYGILNSPELSAELPLPTNATLPP